MFSANVPLILVLTGCVALLAALFGGGVKTKDIEIPKITRMPRIFSGLTGAVLIGAATWLYIRPSSPSAPQPTETPQAIPSATFTALPASTDMASPSSTPQSSAATATPFLSASPTPIVPDPTNPVGFLRYYFDMLTDRRNYGEAWQLLTRKYQKQFYSNDYVAYGGYWGAVKHVNLDSVQVTQLNATSVDAHVQMTLIMTSGLSEQLAADYRLIYDSNARTWMFDSP